VEGRRVIFDFFAALPEAVLADGRFRFRRRPTSPAEHDAVGKLALPRPVSWADAERDVSAWLGNPMQRAANDALYAIRPRRPSSSQRPGERALARPMEETFHFRSPLLHVHQALFGR
jgi:alpha-amylase/alpha-mannosidase (GH57 family)